MSNIVMVMQNPLKCSILMTCTMSIIFIFHILVSKNCNNFRFSYFGK